jgi:hypothetical protein
MNPPHCYYPQGFFEAFADRRGMAVKVFDQAVSGYTNSRYRYNVLFCTIS